MQCNALAEVKRSFVKCLPVQVQLEIVRKVNPNISTSRYTPECRAQLEIVDPDFNVCTAEEDVKTTCVVQVEMTDDDLLDVIYGVACGFNRGTKFMLGFVFGTTKDVGYLLAPNYTDMSVQFD